MFTWVPSASKEYSLLFSGFDMPLDKIFRTSVYNLIFNIYLKSTFGNFCPLKLLHIWFCSMYRLLHMKELRCMRRKPVVNYSKSKCVIQNMTLVFLRISYNLSIFCQCECTRDLKPVQYGNGSNTETTRDILYIGCFSLGWGLDIDRSSIQGFSDPQVI
jgi:hypothetical protein